MKLYAVIPDIHDRPPNKRSLRCKTYHPAVTCILNVLKAIKPYGIILLGDTSDMESLTYFDKDKRKIMEGKRYGKDIDSVNHLLDKLQKYGKEKIYCMGNHEARVKAYCNQHSEVDGTFDYERDTGLVERGYEVVPYNHTKKIGHALFMHGFDASANHAKKMAHIYPKTLFYGHTHDVQTYSFVSPIDYKEKRIASSLGCLCNMNPHWLRYKPNKWVHAFGLLSVKENKQFQMDIKYIIQGKVIAHGKEI